MSEHGTSRTRGSTANRAGLLRHNDKIRGATEHRLWNCYIVFNRRVDLFRSTSHIRCETWKEKDELR